jgi:hypothetical protein
MAKAPDIITLTVIAVTRFGRVLQSGRGRRLNASGGLSARPFRQIALAFILRISSRF